MTCRLGMDYVSDQLDFESDCLASDCNLITFVTTHDLICGMWIHVGRNALFCQIRYGHVVVDKIVRDACSSRSMNPLAAAYFFATFQLTRRKYFTYLHLTRSFFPMFTVWHGLFIWYSCFLGCEWKLCPYLQYRVSVYTKSLKRRTRKLNLCSYVLSLVQINISFHLSKVGSHETNLSAIRA